MYHHYWRTWTGLLLEIAGEIFDLPCSSRLLSATCLYKLRLFYCRLTPEPEVTTVSNSSTSSHILLNTNIRFCQNSTWVELAIWSLRQRGYRHRISDAAPSHNPERCAPPIVVIRESGLNYRTRTRSNQNSDRAYHHYGNVRFLTGSRNIGVSRMRYEKYAIWHLFMALI